MSRRTVAAVVTEGFVMFTSHMTPLCSKGIRVAVVTATPPLSRVSLRRPASCVAQRVAEAETWAPLM